MNDDALRALQEALGEVWSGDLVPNARPGRRTPAVKRFQKGLAWDERRHGGTRCLLWTGSHNGNGYGRFTASPERGTVAAHRWAYEYWVAPIPAGFQIDHLCRNRLCVNPTHLEAVTPRENSLRSESPPAANAKKRSCPHGHPYDEANTYIDPLRGWRQCLTCRRQRVAISNRARRRAA